MADNGSRARRVVGSALLAITLLGPACGAAPDERRVTVVASLYPLAWAAERVGGDRVTVTDITPPGGEAHDVTLTAGQRADLQTADVVLLLGRFGFQPDVERAADEAKGAVVDVTDGMGLIGAGEGELLFDPHMWLDPSLMSEVVRTVGDALAEADPGSHDGYERREANLLDELDGLDHDYAEGLSGCGFSTFVATHEAFGYLARRYGLEQLGIEGVAPESEPSAERLEAVREAIQSGRAAPAVFAEATDAGRRIAESVAGELGVPVYPLATLESAPTSGEYLSVMRDNLERLEEAACR